MRLYQVIDCTKAMGCACHRRGKLAARLTSMWLTVRTGRFHDYVPATAWSRLYQDMGLAS